MGIKDFTFRGFSFLSILLMCLSVVESITIICLELSTLSMTQFSCQIINVYLSIFIFSRIFQVILVFDAVKNKNTIQLIGLCIFSFVCFGYSIIQVSQILNLDPKASVCQPDPTKPIVYTNFHHPLLYAVTVILGVVSFLYAFLSFQLYKEFGWEIYKKIGADTLMKDMYLQYQIYLLLLKLAVFFFMGFSLQFLVLILRDDDMEFWLNILAFPIILLILVVAVYGVRYENRKLIILFLVGLVAAAIYFLFKLVRIYYPEQNKYTDYQRGLTMFATMTLLTVVACAVQTYFCYRNFGRGLSNHLKKSKKAEYLAESPIRTLNLGDD